LFEQFNAGSYTIDDMSENEEDNQQAHSSVPQAVVRQQAPAISHDQLSAVLSMLNQQQRQQQQAPTTSQASNIFSQLAQPSANQQPQQQQPPPPQPAAPVAQPVPPAQAQAGLFDRNFFQNVMQQVMTQRPESASSNNNSSTLSSANPPSAAAQSGDLPDLAAKLEQMHELGFLDDVLNIRALQITEGNVDAAVSLLIEGGDLI
jgi:hypothetical protein